MSALMGMGAVGSQVLRAGDYTHKLTTLDVEENQHRAACRGIRWTDPLADRSNGLLPEHYGQRYPDRPLTTVGHGSGHRHLFAPAPTRRRVYRIRVAIPINSTVVQLAHCCTVTATPPR